MTPGQFYRAVHLRALRDVAECRTEVTRVLDHITRAPHHAPGLQSALEFWQRELAEATEVEAEAMHRIKLCDDGLLQ